MWGLLFPSEQAQYFQKRLNREIDHLRRNQSSNSASFMDAPADFSSDMGSNDPDNMAYAARSDSHVRIGQDGRTSPYAKKIGPANDPMDDYFDNLVLTPDGSPVKGTGKGKGKASNRPQSSGPVLRTRSESFGTGGSGGRGESRKKRLAAAMRQKKDGRGSKFSIPGKGFFSKKKPDRSAVAPMSDMSDRPEWVDPSFKDYRFSAGKSTSTTPGRF